MDLIPVAGPWITQKEIDYVADGPAMSTPGTPVAARTQEARWP